MKAKLSSPLCGESSEAIVNACDRVKLNNELFVFTMQKQV